MKMRAYRVCWSLVLATTEQSGVVNGHLSAYDDRMVQSSDHFWEEYVQAERDPYIYEPLELGFVAKPRRRSAA